MNIANYTLNFLAPNALAFEESTKNPIRAQEKVLFRILKRNRTAEYGIKNNFSKVKSIKDYRSYVPFVDYETIRPLIERLMRGENNILTSDKVIFFGTTSGTTSKPKLIPLTKYSKSEKNSLMDLWVYYLLKSHPRITDGKILAIISPEVEGFSEEGKIPYGAESGYAYKHQNSFIRRLYALPYEVFNIKDYEARYYCILRIAVEENITTLSTLNPSTIVLLCQKLEKFKNKIIRDIRDGALDKELVIPLEARRAIEKHLRPNPKRADELEVILKDKPFIPKYFWPNLELIECWMGGTVKIYLKDLPKYFGNVAIRDLGYLSTEARSSLPVNDNTPEGVLAINTNFYEFIPKEDIDKSDKRVMLCDELEVGKEYFVILTTPGGLYRYNIDDIIRVSGFFNKTPLIQFVQKGLSSISITGEKLYEAQVVEAVNNALKKARLSVKFFSATFEWDDFPHYVFLSEFNDDVPLSKKMEFLNLIESELYIQNTEYKDIRMQQLLGEPVLKIVKFGDFEKYRAQKIADGAHEGQFKMPQLVSDPEFQNNFTIVEKISLEKSEVKNLL